MSNTDPTKTLGTDSGAPENIISVSNCTSVRVTLFNSNFNNILGLLVEETGELF
jgi:hypothetical protein